MRVLCLTYGYVTGLVEADFLYATGHDRPLPPVPLSLYLIEGAGPLTLVDVGASTEWALRKGVVAYREPTALLGTVAVRPDEIERVVLTHLHWDHASAVSDFPRALVVVQRAELEGWEGAIDLPADLAWVHRGRVERELLDHLRRPGRCRIVEGDVDLGDGVRCYLAPGHTFGNQLVVVGDAPGQIVLAGDAVFLRENVERMIPLGNGIDQIAQLRAFQRARDLATSGVLVPGHDPTVVGAMRAITDQVAEVV